MKSSLQRVRTAMIVAPHPDDEAIGAFGLIRMLRRAGMRVRVLVVSDGAASHPGSPTWPKVRLVAERRRETLRAMARAGVNAERITHLGLPDGQLALLGARDWRPLSRALHQCAPDLIVGPSPADAHPDHIAVARALARLRLSRARRLTYRVWPTQGARVHHFGNAVRVRATSLAKLSVLRLYRTQTGTIADSPAGFIMSRAERARFAHPCEWFEAL